MTGPPTGGGTGPRATRPDDTAPDHTAPDDTAPDDAGSETPDGPRRHGRGRRRRLRTALLAGPVVVVGLLAWAVVWYEGQVSPGRPGRAVIVEVPAGASVSAVSATLARDGVVGSSLAFRIYLFLHGTPTVQPGGYELRRREGFAAVHALLGRGPDVFAVHVVAGTTVAEVASQVDDIPGHSAAAFGSAVTSGAVRSPWEPAAVDNLDGLLGPGTYVVVPGETDVALLRHMVDRFDTVAATAGLAAAAAAQGVTPYQAVTIASIVQKEGISPGDSADATAHNVGRVARVIYNRLAAGMPLQMDATVLYAEGRDGGPVTPADEATPTPYNTYLHTGLVPTPICFPSSTALAAALHPPTGEWLYFELTSSDGTETFSDTFAGQLAAEQLARSRGLP